MDEDVTIEDEFESIDDFTSKSLQNKKTIDLLINNQWIVSICLFILVLLLILILKKLFSKQSLKLSNKKDEKINEYERMISVREKQQLLYQQQMQHAALLKQQKLKEITESTEKSKPLRYRSNDHNPLTGQSMNNKSDSCSWRPSSSRRRPQGG